MSDYQEKKNQKDEEVRQALRARQMKKIVRWLIILAIVGGLGYWAATYLNRPTDPVSGQFFPSQSRDHIAEGAQHPAYNSNPPTGGWHYASPVQTGIYDKAFPDEQLVHNLEHGHIWIAYRPDLPANQIEKLADIAKSYSSKIIMAPRPNNPALISVVGWEYLLSLDTLNEDAIKDFIKDHRGKGPESVPDYGFDDFRGK